MPAVALQWREMQSAATAHFSPISASGTQPTPFSQWVLFPSAQPQVSQAVSGAAEQLVVTSSTQTTEPGEV
jgi:hypothetical protein